MSRAKDFQLISCNICHHLNHQSNQSCEQCHSPLKERSYSSLSKTNALLALAWILYIPANIFPVMVTTSLGSQDGSTIIGGVFIFLEHGSYFIAAVIFIASVVIPMAKMFVLGWLSHCVRKKGNFNYYQLTKMYRLTELVGKWSMIDVFVVVILVALIRLQGLMTINPGIAANAFAGVVIATMLAALSFDTRLLWDKLHEDDDSMAS